MNLHERILAEIEVASGQHPARASAVFASLDGVTPEAFNAAMDALERQRRICTCQITRGGATWKVLWPTGVIVPSAGWSNESNKALFAPRIPRRCPQAPNERNQEPVMATRNPTIEMRVAALREAIDGKGKANAVAVIDVGRSIGCDMKNLKIYMQPAVDRLVKSGEAIAFDQPFGKEKKSQFIYDARVANDTEIERELTPLNHPVKAAESAPADGIRLCMYDDACMVIEQGDARMELAPEATRKLFRFVAAMEGIATGAAQ